jgi:hypothetical protein
MSFITRNLAQNKGLDSMVFLQISGGPFFYVSFRSKGSRWTLHEVKIFVENFQALFIPPNTPTTEVDATTAPASIVNHVCKVIECGWLKLIKTSTGSSVETSLKNKFGKEALVDQWPPSTEPPQSSSKWAGTPGAFLI